MIFEEKKGLIPYVTDGSGDIWLDRLSRRLPCIAEVKRCVYRNPRSRRRTRMTSTVASRRSGIGAAIRLDLCGFDVTHALDDPDEGDDCRRRTRRVPGCSRKIERCDATQKDHPTRERVHSEEEAPSSSPSWETRVTTWCDPCRGLGEGGKWNEVSRPLVFNLSRLKPWTCMPSSACSERTNGWDIDIFYAAGERMHPACRYMLTTLGYVRRRQGGRRRWVHEIDLISYVLLGPDSRRDRRRGGGIEVALRSLVTACHGGPFCASRHRAASSAPTTRRTYE